MSVKRYYGKTVIRRIKVSEEDAKTSEQRKIDFAQRHDVKKAFEIIRGRGADDSCIFRIRRIQKRRK